MALRNKYRPYIRKANGREKSNSLRIAFRLAFYQTLGKPFYVMVQRGFPLDVMDVGPSKRKIKESLFAFPETPFSKWCSAIQRQASGRK